MNDELASIQILTVTKIFLTAERSQTRNNKGMEILDNRAIVWNVRWIVCWTAYAAIRLIILIG